MAACCEKAFEQVARNENRVDLDNDRGAGWISMRYDVTFYVAQCSAKVAPEFTTSALMRFNAAHSHDFKERDHICRR